jgi:hypothetical protein
LLLASKPSEEYFAVDWLKRRVLLVNTISFHHLHGVKPSVKDLEKGGRGK